MSNWKSIVRTVAPVLAGTFGTPFAGTAVKFLADKFLGPEDSGDYTDNEAKEAKLEKMFADPSPELLLELKRSDHEFKTSMASIGLKTEQLHQKDRDSARALATQTSIVPQLTLSAIFIVGYFGLIATLLYIAVKHSQLSIPTDLAILLGVMTAAIPQILNFWFGSSRSSQSKDDHHRHKELGKHAK
jgi:hypothetical protein